MKGKGENRKRNVYEEKGQKRNKHIETIKKKGTNKFLS
jgi:hypothetical protein